MGSWVLATNACSSGTMRIRWNIELFRKEVLAHARMDEHLGVLRTTLVGYAAHYCSPLPPVNGVFPGYGGKYARGADECLEPDRRMRGLLVDECGFEGVYPCGSPAMVGGSTQGSAEEFNGSEWVPGSVQTDFSQGKIVSRAQNGAHPLMVSGRGT